MKLTILPIDEKSVRQLIGWHYEPPYDYYNYQVNEEEIAGIVAYYVDPKTSGFAIYDERKEFVGFCSFGDDGQVGGGDYRLDALDIGMGVRPNLTGKGKGRLFAEAVIGFAETTFAPKALRVTIAAFNERAQRVWLKLGFVRVEAFESTFDGVRFVTMVRNPVRTHDVKQEVSC